VCGAKAIVVKMKWRSGASEFCVLVLPGPTRIDTRLLLDGIVDLKSFRFATAGELALETEGLEPGMMPPFGKPIFERIARIYVDKSLLDRETLGFNAASLTCSIVVCSRGYVKAAAPDAVFPFTSAVEV
jgi:prolyl-tRNA editing enzyme YbaK/EbsC (Cys-tRNA(Pro) deacylase)